MDHDPHILGARPTPLGLALDLRPGERELAARVRQELRALGVEWLRTTLVCERGSARAVSRWARWLLPRLSEDLQVVPVLRAGPATAPWEYAAIVGDLLRVAGERLAAVELVAPWFVRGLAPDPRAPDLRRGGAASAGREQLGGRWGEHLGAWREAVSAAADEVQAHGWKVVIGGLRPEDVPHLQGPPPTLLARAHAVSLEAVEGEPGQGLALAVALLRSRLGQWAVPAATWVTRGGSDDGAPTALLDVARGPADRLFWRDGGRDAGLASGALRPDDRARVRVPDPVRGARLARRAAARLARLHPATPPVPRRAGAVAGVGRAA